MQTTLQKLILSPNKAPGDQSASLILADVLPRRKRRESAARSALRRDRVERITICEILFNKVIRHRPTQVVITNRWTVAINHI